MRIQFLLFAALVSAFAGVSAMTIDVDKAVEIALENSEELRAAKNAVTQSKLDKKVARTAYLPNFSGSATGMCMLPDYEDMGMKLRMKGVYMAGISLQQPVFAGGKIVAANRLAGIGARVAAERLRQTEISVKANAETSYWSYVAVLSKVEMMRSYRAQVDTAYTMTRNAVDAGMATRTDLLRMEARRSQVIYQQEQVSGGADLCRMALCDALGLPYDTPIEVADTEIAEEIPAGLGIYDPEQRPEIRMMHADIEAKEQQVRMTRADFLPQLGLQAGWSAYGGVKMDMMTQGPDGNYYPVSNKINGNSWSIMLGLQVPIFHWGEGINKVKRARLDVENARLNLENNSRKLDLQVRQAVSNIRTGVELLRSAKDALTQAEAALKSTTESYSLGMAPVTDLLDAQSQWHTARASLTEARAQLRIHIVDYYAATAQL